MASVSAATGSAPPAPFTAAYAQLAAVYPALTVRLGSTCGATTTADLAADPELRRAALAAEAARCREAYQEELRPDVAATFCLHRVVWPTALVFTLPWLLERRVPLLAPHQLAFSEDRDGATAAVSAFACLPDDPVLGAPGAEAEVEHSTEPRPAAGPSACPVADEAALRAALRQALVGHLAPLLDSFRPLLRRGPHTLWGLVADDLVEGLWYIGSLLGHEAEAVAALRALLPGGTATAPLSGAAAFRRIAPTAPPTAPIATATDTLRTETPPGTADTAHTPGTDASEGAVGAGGAFYTRTRISCCLYYTVTGAETCFTCPRTARSV
jgi:hypothetical protein